MTIFFVSVGKIIDNIAYAHMNRFMNMTIRDAEAFGIGDDERCNQNIVIAYSAIDANNRRARLNALIFRFQNRKGCGAISRSVDSNVDDQLHSVVQAHTKRMARFNGNGNYAIGRSAHQIAGSGNRYAVPHHPLRKNRIGNVIQ